MNRGCQGSWLTSGDQGKFMDSSLVYWIIVDEDLIISRSFLIQKKHRRSLEAHDQG